MAGEKSAYRGKGSVTHQASKVKRLGEARGNQGKNQAAKVKALIIEYVKQGRTIKDALDDCGYTYDIYKYYRRTDPVFKDQMDRMMEVRKLGLNRKARGEMISFPEFCETYLGTRLFNHHLQWLDLLEGREPRNLHPAQTYHKGEPEAIIVNTPPEHAKSTTLTVNYVTYRICEDPNVRIIIISKTQEMAKRFLRAVKDRLAGTNPAYAKLQMEFAPEGGFSANSSAWTADAIYISGDMRDSGEPSPTVQALGIKGQIYGSRADLIIMDDCIDSGNAHEFEKQIDWVQNEVNSRLAVPGGRLIIVGTRLATVDLYSEIQKSEYYGDEESPYTYLTQPAVLEFADEPKDWVTLWPRTNRPPVSLAGRKEVAEDEDGLYPMWNGPALSKKRARMSPRNWSMVYMQEQVVADAIFDPVKVVGCIDSQRFAGPMVRGGAGHRPAGMDGLYVIGGFDPALTGNSAAVILGVDRETGVRWVLETWTRGNLKPDDLRDKIKELTAKYRVNEWRVEKNAMNLMVSQDREINQYLASRGCLLREHFTGSNKWDADFGVASMAGLFEYHEKGENLIRLPSRTNSEGTRHLVEQLVGWEPLPPGRKNRKKTDCVMALWFAEIRARELLSEVYEGFHLPNEYAAPRDMERQVVVDLDYMSMNMHDMGSWRRL